MIEKIIQNLKDMPIEKIIETISSISKDEAEDLLLHNMILSGLRSLDAPVEVYKKIEEDEMFDCFQKGKEYTCRLESTKQKQKLLKDIKEGNENACSDAFLKLQNGEKDETIFNVYFNDSIADILNDVDFWIVYDMQDLYHSLVSTDLPKNRTENEKEKNQKDMANCLKIISQRHIEEYDAMIKKAQQLEDSKGSMTEEEYQKQVALFKDEMQSMKERHKAEMEQFKTT